MLPIEQLSAVSNTALLTLWARAIEARSPNPLLIDPEAVAITESLRPFLATHQTEFHQQLLADHLPVLLTRLMALRARYFDERALNFLTRFPRAIVVNLGAGLDTRFERLNQHQNARVRVIDIDLPPLIELKQTLITPHPRHELLPASVLDFAWMEALARYDDRQLIFLAEGLLMYFPPHEVERLVTTLAHRFPGCELVADVFHARILRPPWKSWAMRKMQRQLQVDRHVDLVFGLEKPNAMEAWDAQIQFLSAWSFFDAHDRKLGWMRLLRHLPFVRWLQYIVHYRLG